MREVVNEDLFDKITEADAIVITTNCSVIRDSDGKLLNPMGALAGQAASRWEQIPSIYAELLVATPNVPVILGWIPKADHTQLLSYTDANKETSDDGTDTDFTALVAYPTIPTIGAPADFNLVKRSAQLLVELADLNAWEKIFLGSPGTGIGGLPVKDVHQMLSEIFDDRFMVMRKDKDVVRTGIAFRTFVNTKDVNQIQIDEEEVPS